MDELLRTAIPSLLILFMWSNLPEIKILLFCNKLIVLIKLFSIGLFQYEIFATEYVLAAGLYLF